MHMHATNATAVLSHLQKLTSSAWQVCDGLMHELHIHDICMAAADTLP